MSFDFIVVSHNFINQFILSFYSVNCGILFYFFRSGSFSQPACQFEGIRSSGTAGFSSQRNIGVSSGPSATVTSGDLEQMVLAESDQIMSSGVFCYV